ncbi:MAG: TolC family protein [Candidatus Melainabacteria bacterium]|jgi:outer membrane protein TolC
MMNFFNNKKIFSQSLSKTKSSQQAVAIINQNNISKLNQVKLSKNTNKNLSKNLGLLSLTSLLFSTFALNSLIPFELPASADETDSQQLSSIWEDFDASNPKAVFKPTLSSSTSATTQPLSSIQPKAQYKTKPQFYSQTNTQLAQETSTAYTNTPNSNAVITSPIVDDPQIDLLIQSQKRAPSVDPFEILKSLNDPNSPPPKNDFLNGADDPSGRDLEKALPLDIPTSERFSDILDPIELDVNRDEVLDLNIEKSLLIALQSNLPQRIIDETVIRDKWRFWNVGSGLLPDIFANYTMQDQSRGLAFSVAGTTHRTQVGLRYNIAPAEIFGTLGAYYDWMANSQFSGTNLQELMKQTTNQYYEVMRARGELAVRIEAVRQAKVQLALNEKLEQAGVGTRFSVLQATEQMAENELALEAQQATTRISEIQLLTLLNMPLGTDIRLEDSQIYKKTLVSDNYAIDELVDFAMSNRPDISRRYLSYKASKSRIAEAAMGFAPSVSASIGTTSFARSATQSLDPGRIDDLRTATVSVDWPVLVGLGLNQISSINQKRAESRQASLEIANEKLQVDGQVRDAFLRSQSAEKQIKSAEKQLGASTEGIKLARIRLQNGVGTNIDLIDTQRNYVNALVNKVRATIQYNQAQVDLLRAIGLISVNSILNQDLAFKDGVDSYQNTVDDNKDDGFTRTQYSSI